MTSSSFDAMNFEINKLKEQLNFSSKGTNGPFVFKKEPNPPESTFSNWNKEPTFNYAKYKDDMNKPNTANVVYGTTP